MKTKSDSVKFRTHLALGFALIAPALTMADPEKPTPIRLEAVVFKEGGRFNPKMVADCNVEQDLRDAMTRALGKPSRPSDRNFEPRGLTLRIDKLDTLGSLGQLGTQVGVSAILTGREPNLFLCQERAPFAMTHCGRITHCAKDIANDVATWLTKVGKTR